MYVKHAHVKVHGLYKQVKKQSKTNNKLQINNKSTPACDYNS